MCVCGREGSPLGYLKFVSRDLIKALDENNLKVREYHCPTSNALLSRREVKEENIFSVDLGNSKSRTQEQQKIAREEIDKFLSDLSQDVFVVFTDGSVKGEMCYGHGGCGTVSFKRGEEEKVIVKSYKVGKVVENVHCEMVGIVKALETCIKTSEEGKDINFCYVFTDCKSAVDLVCKQRDTNKYWDEFQKLWTALNKLEERKIDLKVVWVPGHADVKWNELADVAAKEGTEIEEESEEVEKVTSSAITYWIKDKIKKEWNRMWNRSETGDWTHSLGLSVGQRHNFPKIRDLGVTYVRALINNTALADSMLRYRLVEDPNCDCGKARETLEHVLLECEVEKDAREEFIEKVGKVWMEKKCSGGLNIDIKLILSPWTISSLSSGEADVVLKFSFEFLSHLSKKF